MLAEMEDRGRKDSTGMALRHTLDQMAERADATAGDHRHRYRIRHRASEREVITVAGPVAVHRGQQYFACAKLGQPRRMDDRVDPCRAAAAMGEDLPFAGRDVARIDRTDDA